MNKLYRIAAAMMAVTSLTATAIVAEDYTAEAPISGVTVYANGGAVVTRQFALEVPAGQHRIMVPGLTADMEESYGVRATIVSGAASITNTEIEEQFSQSPAYGRRRALEEQIHSLRLEQERDHAKVKAVEMQLDFLRKLGSWSGGQSLEGFASADDMLSALERSYAFVRDNGSAALAEQINAEASIAARAREIQALQRQLGNLGPGQVSTIAGTVNLTANASERLTIELSYLVEDADWDLALDANLDTTSSVTQVSLYAAVTQYTDEDWTDVPLVLSTTAPSDEIAPLMPSPVYYNLEDPAEDRRLSRGRLEMVGNPESDQELEEIVVVTGSRIQAASTAFDVEFTVDGRVSVPADGTTQQFRLGGASAPGEQIIRIVPQDGNGAFVFLDGQFTDIPILNAGHVSLTRDGTFVGTSEWPQIVPNTSLKLPFGIDERIKLQVITVPSEEGETGIFNRNQVEEEKKRFVVTNNHNTAMTVEVFDLIPNSNNEDLEITPLRGNTRPSETDVDGQPGVLMWRKILEPGEIWEINHWYRISYPTDKRLVNQ